MTGAAVEKEKVINACSQYRSTKACALTIV